MDKLLILLAWLMAVGGCVGSQWVERGAAIGLMWLCFMGIVSFVVFAICQDDKEEQ